MQATHPTRSIMVTLAFLPALFPLTHAAATGFTQRVNVGPRGVQSNGYSQSSPQAFMSFDGRYTVFASDASNLVPGDTNNLRDIFVYDRWTGRTERVNVDSNGNQATRSCANIPPTGSADSDAAISADGRYVVFSSSADNLVPDDTNCQTDIFLHDRKTHKTIRVSVAAHGSEANGWSGVPSISADNRYVVFWSQASNLVSDDTNGFLDVFVRDLKTGKTVLASVSSAEEQGNDNSGPPTISADGRYVAFGSNAGNLVSFDDINDACDIFLRDLRSGITTLVSADPVGFSGNASSCDVTNLNNWYNFVPSLSADGRYVAFSSYATNLVGGDINGNPDVFVRDMKTKKTAWASVDSYAQQAFGGLSYRSGISADGRFVSFISLATNLDPANHNGQNQVFIHDRINGQTTMLSFSTDGVLGDQSSFSSSLSADGRYAAIYSVAGNLVPGDTSSTYDIFLRDRLLDSRHQADLHLTQSTASTTVEKGQNFSYTLTLSNAGEDTATNATIVDIPPAQGPLVAVKPSQGSCTRVAIIVCRLGNVKAGANAKVVITVKAVTAGQFFNQASAYAAPVDLTPLDNTSTLRVTVNP